MSEQSAGPTTGHGAQPMARQVLLALESESANAKP
jgi:hypothetical protein